MKPDSIEQLFETYRRTSDGTALGEVFDRTAQDLYRLAVHLVKDVALAEDLVQNTFLAAIETAARWRSDRPLFPWLLGILTNKLRMYRRRAGTIQTHNKIFNIASIQICPLNISKQVVCPVHLFANYVKRDSSNREYAC